MKHCFAISTVGKSGRLAKAAMLAMVMLSVSLPVSAQWRIGVSAGYARNILDIDTGYAYDREYEPGGGLVLSVPGQYDFTEWFGLRAELSYMQKGYGVYRTGMYYGICRDVINHYLQLPVMADFSFGGKRLRGFVNLGGYLGGWLSSWAEGNTVRVFEPSDVDLIYYSGKVEFDSRRDNRFEAGLVGGVGISYRVSALMTLEAEWRYYYSLTDMQKQYMYSQTPRYNTTMAFQIGCIVNLGEIR